LIIVHLDTSMEPTSDLAWSAGCGVDTTVEVSG
jgi:hypothetical protein